VKDSVKSEWGAARKGRAPFRYCASLA